MKTGFKGAPLAALRSMSMGEIDKANLGEYTATAFPTLYKQKYRMKFGKEPDLPNMSDTPTMETFAAKSMYAPIAHLIEADYDTLHKNGGLEDLMAIAPQVYREKYKLRFGCYPNTRPFTEIRRNK